MPALVAGIHVLLLAMRPRRGWPGQAGTSPGMTESKLKLMRAFCGPRATRRRARSQAALRVGISAEDAAPEVLLGCSPLCARFSEFALTKAVVVALTMSGSTDSSRGHGRIGL